MAAYYASHISPNQCETPAEGYRICRNVPICGTGSQDYFGAELKRHPNYQDAWNLNDHQTYKVHRPLSEVTSPQTIATAEGKTVVDEHPPEHIAPGSLISIDTERELSCGHAQNVRIGDKLPNGETPLLADLHIKDDTLIDKIDAGIRDISCGYTYDLQRLDSGTFIQTDIRINHVAVVPQGRAGADVAIKDSAPDLVIPELEELIEDDDPFDEILAAMQPMDTFATTDARHAGQDPSRFWRGVSWNTGQAAYQAHAATDASAPELPPSHFFAGVPHGVGKARYDAYLAARAN